MSQHDFNIANAAGAVVRADINDALEAFATCSAGPDAPAPSYPHQCWFDESTSLLKMRNAANTAWITIALKDGDDWTPYALGAPLGDAAGGVIGVDVQPYDAATAKTNVVQFWTKAQGFTPQAPASAAGALAIDFTNGNVAVVTLAESITAITLSATRNGDTYKIIFKQAAGAFAVTGWPVAVLWSDGGAAPAISTTDGAYDVVTIEAVDDVLLASVAADHRAAA